MLRTFALLTLSACTVASASASIPKTTYRSHTKDTRVFVTLENKSDLFRDLKIGDQNYTVLPHRILTVKAPAGTMVYANSVFGKYHRGDALLEITPSVNNQRISIN